ncbi:MAG: hypothetical protein ACRDY1_05600 [Acidimicrobiales bacterium]
MSAARHDAIPETVVVDGWSIDDACWLLCAVEEFALFGDVEGVDQLIRLANRPLSATGLATVAGELCVRLRRQLEAAR